MIETTKKITIKKYRDGFFETDDDVVVEYSLAIYLNNNYFVSLLCSPEHLEELVFGYLYSEGIIASKDDVLSISIDSEKGKAVLKLSREDIFKFSGDQLIGETTVTTACGKGRKVVFPVVREGSDEKIRAIEVQPEDVFRMVRDFNKSSELFLKTGGVHSCALCTKDEILYSRDDIGRHNALEKILGKALIDGIDLKDKVVLSTGRMSSEIVDKVILRGIPVLISRSAPTDEAINRAKKVGLKLIGFVRGEKMNVYT
ncbi:formate dehydrogenase accessory sulfurtransferase FdhD [Alkalibacter mobilis]|uniref:formate dehydrogenase accessory sulfurtransferase FdhD n=1 Tax=Alkalibacter mobilis TaxID=2787712 RepID=UPI00189E817B|nr:formate dehydrogenase accessory sulfurtransferase FdhD [Alkalibacter mobilis]